jgi:glycine oxidase
VKPIRGQLLRLAWSHGILPARVVWGPGCYTVPWSDGTLLVGATVEDVGFDESSTLSGMRALAGAAADLLPGADRAAIIDVRVGLRPATESGLPVIGPAPEAPNVIFATGHYRNGVLLSPLTASLVAQCVFEGALP